MKKHKPEYKNTSKILDDHSLNPILSEINRGFDLKMNILFVGVDLDYFINELNLYYNKINIKTCLIDSLEIDDNKQLIEIINFENNMKVLDGILLSNEYEIILIKNIDMNDELLSFLSPLIKNGMMKYKENIIKKKIICTAKKNIPEFYNIYHNTVNDSFVCLIKNFEDKRIQTYHFLKSINTLPPTNDEKLSNNINKEINEFLKTTTGDLSGRIDFYKKILLEMSHKNNVYKQSIKDYLKKILMLTDLQILESISYFVENEVFKQKFVLTESLIDVILCLISCIEKNIPVILVGETGTGKTTLLQEVYKIYSTDKTKNLNIINLSQETDLTDLTGNYNIKENEFSYLYSVFMKSIIKGEWILLDEINLCSESTINFIQSIIMKKSIFDFNKNKPINFNKNFRLFSAMNEKGKTRFEGKGFKKIYVDDFMHNPIDVQNVVNKLLKFQDNKFHVFINDIISRKYTGKKEFFITGRNLSRILKNAMNIKSLVNLIDLVIFSKLDVIEEIEANKILQTYYNEALQTQKNDEGFLIYNNSVYEENYQENDFIITDNIKKTIKRVMLGIKYDMPILLYGDTSTGKTSIIKYISNILGKKLYRVNNHKNTEISDYVGYYGSGEKCSEKNEKMNFKFIEGVLVKAMKNGDFILLDELNLAPSDVLEALNRLLDENKEFYSHEFGVIKPHPDFRIFATQNENYAGRNVLTDALRNRFIELHVQDKSYDEITEILKNYIPNSFIEIIIEIYKNLKRNRNINVLVTLREIFKWVRRKPSCKNTLYFIGMMLLYEKQRKFSDRKIVHDIFNKVFKQYNKNMIFNENTYSGLLKEEIKHFDSIKTENYFIYTNDHLKLGVLIKNCWDNFENALIVGKTGLGKTKIIENLSKLYNQRITTINFNSDFDVTDLIGSYVVENNGIKFKYGPVVNSMINGDILLLDEINLCDDAIIERLNSLFDSRTLFITEINKEIESHKKFKIVATMNPGDDFGKKELSPALRNRFTEIYFRFNEYKTICEYFKVNYEYIKNIENISIRQIEIISKFLNNNKDKTNINFLNKEIHSLIDHKYMENYLNYKYINKNFVHNENEVGIKPYLININKIDYNHLNQENKENMSINFNLKTINFYKLCRALTLDIPILISGEPGVGKTSLVVYLSNILNMNYIRVNLSDQTEFADLIGSIDLQNNFKFKESGLVKIIRNGGIIILDELNLCDQSILEGLNSLLDYRKSIVVNNEKIQNKARIIATMNPPNNYNDRKELPKSFLDRFVKIEFKYTKHELKNILTDNKSKTCYYKFLKYGSLRNALKMIDIGENYVLKYIPKYKTIENEKLSTKNKYLSSNYFINLDIKDNKTIHQNFYNTTDKIKPIKNFREIYMGNTVINIPENYTLLSKNLWCIEIFYRSMYLNFPLILKGLGVNKLLNFFDKNEFYCYNEMDISDFIGEYKLLKNYTKNIDGNETNIKFKYIESDFIKYLTEDKILVIYYPDKIPKNLFDRLNSIFDSKTFLITENNEYKKIKVNCKIILVIKDDIQNLSPALIDRCIYLEFSDSISQNEHCKIIGSEQICEKNIFKIHSNDKIYLPFINNSIIYNDLDIFIESLIRNKESVEFNRQQLKINLRKIKKYNIFYNYNWCSNILDNFKVENILNTKKSDNLKKYLTFAKYNNKYKDIIQNIYKNQIYNINESKIKIINIAMNLDNAYTNKFNDILFSEYKINLNNEFNKIKQYNTEEIKINAFLNNTILNNNDNIKLNSIKLLLEEKNNIIFEYINYLLSNNIKEKHLKILTSFYKYNIYNHKNIEKISKLLEIRKINREILINIYSKYYYRDTSNLNDYIDKINVHSKNIDELRNLLLFFNNLGNSYNNSFNIEYNNDLHKLCKDKNIEILENNFEDLIYLIKAKIYNIIEKLLYKKNIIYELINRNNFDIINCLDKLDKKYITNSVCKLLYCKLFNIDFKIYMHEFVIDSLNKFKFDIPEEYTNNLLLSIYNYINKESDNTNNYIEKINELIYKNIPNPRIKNYTILYDLIKINNTKISIKNIENYILNSTVRDFHNKIYLTELLIKKNILTNNIIYNFTLLYYLIYKKIDEVITKNINTNYLNNKISNNDLDSIFILGYINTIDIKIDTKISKCTSTCSKYYNIYYIEELNKSNIKCICYQYNNNIYNMRDIIHRIKINKKTNVIKFLNRKMHENIYNNLDIHLGYLIYLYFKNNRKYENLILQAIEYPFLPYILFLIELFNLKIPDEENMVDDGNNEKLQDTDLLDNYEFGEENDNESIEKSNDGNLNEIEDISQDNNDNNNDSVDEDDNNIEDNVDKEIYNNNNNENISNNEDINNNEQDKIDEDNQINESIEEDSNNTNENNDNLKEINKDELLDEASSEEVENKSLSNYTDESIIEDEKLSSNISEISITEDDDTNNIENDDNSKDTENNINSKEDKENISEDINNTEDLENSINEMENNSENLNENNKDNVLNLNKYTSEYEKNYNSNDNIKISDNFNNNITDNALEENEKGNIEEYFKKDNINEKEMFEENNLVIDKFSNFDTKIDFTTLLKNILTLNSKSKYSGGYKTGKKLNLKRIVEFIASDYKKDKIFMRKNANNKRKYKFRIFIDNSLSMNQDGNYINVLKNILHNFKESLINLKIDFELYKFSNNFERIQNFDELTFTDNYTDLNWINNANINNFDDGFNIIFTDGIFQNINSSTYNKFLLVIFDKNNVAELESVKIIGNEIIKYNYLDKIKMKYCLINKKEDLESIFISSLCELIELNIY